MNFEGMRTALRILTTPEIEKDGFAFAAEHDELFILGKERSELTASELLEMEKAGWHWDEENEGWTCFT